MLCKKNTRKLLCLTLLLVSLVLTIPAFAQQPTYTVQPGDQLRFIAAKYNTTWQAFAEINNLPNANVIYIGQVLLIPPTGGPVITQPVTTQPVNQPVRYHTVREGEQLRFIALYYGTTWEAFAQMNNLPNANTIYVGQQLIIPPTGGPVIAQPVPQTSPIVGGRYIVQSGDTMFKIGARFNVNVWDIAQANGLLNLNQIYTGQSLIIPGY
jgi:lysozyme